MCHIDDLLNRLDWSFSQKILLLINEIGHLIRFNLNKYDLNLLSKMFNSNGSGLEIKLEVLKLFLELVQQIVQQIKLFISGQIHCLIVT